MRNLLSNNQLINNTLRGLHLLCLMSLLSVTACGGGNSKPKTSSATSLSASSASTQSVVNSSAINSSAVNSSAVNSSMVTSSAINNSMTNSSSINSSAINNSVSSNASFASSSTGAANKKILMFISHEDVYYSEYIVLQKAIEASGYTVDVRSAATSTSSFYMPPAGTDIEATANTLPNSSYADFTAQFNTLFGSVWSSQWNAMPSKVSVDGRLQDVADMSGYAALVVVGGTGINDYRVDGSYNTQGTGNRLALVA
jgi:hypothetical protein